MNVSQKCQYALRAVFELAKRAGDNVVPTTIGELAQVQAIPPKFLELILRELRQAGFVVSRRGMHGGYFLHSPPFKLTVGELIRFVDGPFAPVSCVDGDDKTVCTLYGCCAFLGLWTRARDAVAEVYDRTTFQDLIDEEVVACDEYVPAYSI